MILHVTPVAAAVAALDIPGIAVARLNEMPQGLTGRPLPLLAPAIDRPYLTDWVARRLTLEGNYHNSYTLNYTLYQATLKDRGLFAVFPDLVASAEKVVNAFQRLVQVNGCKRIELAGWPQLGPVSDASDQKFHGATFALRVQEY